MAGVNKNVVLVLVLVLLVVSITGTYIILSSLYAPPTGTRAPASSQKGVVGVEILSNEPKSPPVRTNGIVSLVILGGNEK